MAQQSIGNCSEFNNKRRGRNVVVNKSNHHHHYHAFNPAQQLPSNPSHPAPSTVLSASGIIPETKILPPLPSQLQLPPVFEGLTSLPNPNRNRNHSMSYCGVSGQNNSTRSTSTYQTLKQTRKQPLPYPHDPYSPYNLTSQKGPILSHENNKSSNNDRMVQESEFNKLKAAFIELKKKCEQYEDERARKKLKKKQKKQRKKERARARAKAAMDDGDHTNDL